MAKKKGQEAGPIEKTTPPVTSVDPKDKEIASLKKQLKTADTIISELQKDAEKQPATTSPYPTAVVDGKKVAVTVRAFIHPITGNKITAEEAVKDPALMKKLVDMKAGFVKKV